MPIGAVGDSAQKSSKGLIWPAITYGLQVSFPETFRQSGTRTMFVPDGGLPWSLRSALDRRIVPYSRSPSLEQSPGPSFRRGGWGEDLIDTFDYR
jgi:hypothetical protein